MVTAMRRLLLTAALPLGLAACAREAGEAAGYGLGRATVGNALVQTGQVSAIESLSARFRAEVPDTVTFAFDDAALDAEARRVLSLQAAFIRAFPEVRFAVTGHADRVGSGGYNYDLGLRRARAAVAFLASQGVSPERLEALVSEGETEPAVPTEGPERQNRRAVTTVRGFVANHPSLLNGRYAEVVFRGYVDSAAAPSGFGESSGEDGGGGGEDGGGEAPAAP